MVQSQLLRFTFLFAVVTANKTELSSALGCWPGSCWKALILNQPFSWYYTYVFGHRPWKPVTRYRGKAVKVTRNHMYKGTPWLLWRRPLTLMSSKQQGISVLQCLQSWKPKSTSFQEGPNLIRKQSNEWTDTWETTTKFLWTITTKNLSKRGDKVYWCFSKHFLV